ncbi:MAG: hypothetical protein R3E32_27490 [Chitinophagales bacterium]
MKFLIIILLFVVNWTFAQVESGYCEIYELILEELKEQRYEYYDAPEDFRLDGTNWDTYFSFPVVEDTVYYKFFINNDIWDFRESDVENYCAKYFDTIPQGKFQKMKIETPRDCSFKNKVKYEFTDYWTQGFEETDYDFEVFGTDTITYSPMRIAFSDVLSNGNFAVAYAKYKFPNSPLGYYCMFAFQRENEDIDWVVYGFKIDRP